MNSNTVREVERRENGWGMKECLEPGENSEDMELGYNEKLGRVEIIPVSELMR